MCQLKDPPSNEIVLQDFSIHYPGRRFCVCRVMAHQYMIWDCAAKKFIECQKWPEYLANQICDRYRAGELKKWQFTIIRGKIRVLSHKVPR